MRVNRWLFGGKFFKHDNPVSDKNTTHHKQQNMPLTVTTLSRVHLVPGYSAQPILQQDVPTIGSFLFDSKLRLSVNRLLYEDWPATSTQKTHYTNVVQEALQNNQNMDTWKVVEDETNGIVGHLFLTRYRSTSTETTRETGDEAKRGNSATTNGAEAPKGMVPAVFRMVTETVKKLDEQAGLVGVDHLSKFSSFSCILIHRYSGFVVWLADAETQGLRISGSRRHIEVAELARAWCDYVRRKHGQHVPKE
jgi:hypothetical protein